jgi:hypothetical protein
MDTDIDMAVLSVDVRSQRARRLPPRSFPEPSCFLAGWLVRWHVVVGVGARLESGGCVRAEEWWRGFAGFYRFSGGRDGACLSGIPSLALASSIELVGDSDVRHVTVGQRRGTFAQSDADI